MKTKGRLGSDLCLVPRRWAPPETLRQTFLVTDQSRPHWTSESPALCRGPSTEGQFHLVWVHGTEALLGFRRLPEDSNG